MKKSLLVVGLLVGLVSNAFGTEPVRVRKDLTEVLESITLEVSELDLEEIEEEFTFELLLPTLEVLEIELEEIEEEDFVVLQSKCDKCTKCNK